MSDFKVTPLRNVNVEPDPDVIGALEDALYLARDGQLRSVAIAGSLTGNRTFTTFSTSNLQDTLGLVSFLHHRLCQKMMSGPADDDD